MTHVRHDPDDLDATGHRYTQKVAHRIRIAEEQLRSTLIEHHHRTSLLAIETVEQTAADQRHPDGLEIPGHRCAILHPRLLRGGRVAAENTDRQIEIGAVRAHRKRGHRTRGFHARKRAYPIHELVPERRLLEPHLRLELGVVESVIRNGHRGHNDVLGPEAGLDLEKARKALDHHSRAEQE